jgi:hypothetical protein
MAMRHRLLSALVMGGLLLALSGTLFALTLGRSAPDIDIPWMVWFATFAVIVVVASWALTRRRVWGFFSAINGGMCWAVAFAGSVQSLPEWAPYREGTPASGVDLALPIAAMLRAALASGYLGIVAVAIGIVLMLAAGWLLSGHDGVKHSHS